MNFAKFLRIPFLQNTSSGYFLIIYADLECIIEEIGGCKNIHENSSTTKVSKHIASGFSMCTISSFRSIENKHDAIQR